MLVTGASGYVGSRLIPRLLAAGHRVVAAMRSPEKVSALDWSTSVSIAKMDATQPHEVAEALQGVHVAYYLLHSMDGSGFADQDLKLARAFGASARDAGVRRLVYLGGLVPDTGGGTSEHLTSRLEVERALRESGVPEVIALRAGILIGGGSTSFELIRRLVDRMPIIPLPHFMEARIQPVSITDALNALVSAATTPMPLGPVDVVGPETLTYRELVRRYAQVAGLRRRFVNVLSIPHLLLSVPATWISGLPGPMVRALVPSLGRDLQGRPGHTQMDSLADVPGGRLDVADAFAESLRPLGSSEQAVSAADPEWADGEIVLPRGRKSLRGSKRRRR